MFNFEKNNVTKKFLIILLVIAVITLSFLIFVKNLEVVIIGNKQVSAEVYSTYNDEGAKVCLFGLCKKNLIYKEKNIVNTSKIGTYNIEYSLFNGKKAIREVTIIDKQPPQIFLNVNEDVMCLTDYANKKYYTAIDNYDGDITDSVKIENKDGKIIYSVFDNSLNYATVSKDVKKNKEKPTITLNGKSTINIKLGNNYVEPGYSASDKCDGDLTNKVSVSSSVNNRKVGSYIIKYTVENNNGISNSVSRTVNVVYGDDRFKKIEKYIIDNNYGISVGYYNLSNGYTYLYNANKVYYGASLIKTLDAMYIYENNLVNNNTRNLVQKAISISDNKSHESLINYIGYDNLKKYGKSMGATNTLTGSDYYGNTTVNDQLIYLKRLYKLLNNSTYGEELKGYFINNYGNFLKFNDTLSIAHKYGYYSNYYHDVGIVFGNNDYIIVVLTTEAKNDYRGIIKNISKLVNNIHVNM